MIERTRSFVRDVLGYDSFVYRTASRLTDSFSILFKEGVTAWLLIRRVRRSKAFVTPLRLRSLKHPIVVRSGTRDIETIVSTIVREEYGYRRPSGDPLWMIDAGSYIGDTAAYFLSRYPRLHVVALEPNSVSYEQAARNLAPYGERAHLLRNGLWGTSTTLYFGGDSTGASVRDEGEKIDVVSIPFLLNRFGIPRIDILKVDIEGAEGSVFETALDEWIDRVGMIMMEIHTPQLEKMICEALRARGFSMERYRSLWYFRAPAELHGIRTATPSLA